MYCSNVLYRVFIVRTVLCTVLMCCSVFIVRTVLCTVLMCCSVFIVRTVVHEYCINVL